MPKASLKAKKTARLLFCVAMLLAGSAAAVRGQSALDAFDPNPNGAVLVALVQADGKVLIAGQFTTVSPNGGAAVARNRIARLNPDGTLDTAFNPNANGTFGIQSIALQADGKILAGGDFTTIGGATRTRIARLDAITGAADSFDPNANGTVRAVAVQADGKILVGGNFTTLAPNGGAAVTRNNIARVNPDGTLDTGFNPNANGGAGGVFAIAVQADGKILVGGQFNGANSIGGATRNYIARLHPTTGLADSFDPNASGWVRAMAVQVDGKILLGGNFQHIGGESQEGIGRVNPDGTLDTVFNSQANDIVRSVAVQADGKVLIGGNFTFVNTSVTFTPRNRMARLDPVTGAPDSFDPNANGAVLAITVQASGKILAGGDFNQLTPNGGAPVNRRFVRLETDGRADQTLNLSAVGSFVYATAVQADGKILIGGNFTTVLGVARNRIARLHANGTLDTAFNPSATGDVYAIAVQADGKILAGGDFNGANSIGGQTRNRIARLDATTGLADSFNPDASGGIRSIAVQADGKILVGGIFNGANSIGGATRNRIARLDASTGLADSFDPNTSGVVHSIAVQTDGKILVGGVFNGANSIGGATRNRIARLDPTSGLADSFDPNANNDVYSITVQADGKILAGGDFSGANSIGGETRNRIARLDAITGAADSFDPNANNTVYSIAVQADGKILAGGVFNGANSIGGATRNRIARLDATTGLADSFDPNANSLVYAIAVQEGGKVLAGGQFSNIGGQTRNLFARLSNDTAATQNVAVSQSTVTWTRGGSSPQFTRVTFEYSTDNLSYTPLGNGTAAGSNWTLTGLSFSVEQNFYIRARGYYRSGYQNGSESMTESVRIASLLPTFTVDDVTLNEGDGGTTNFVFTVTSTGSPMLTSVDFQTQDGTATIADGDYVANSGTLTFAANETSKTITVLVNGDTTIEPNEAFTVNLNNASGATISDNTGTGTITNDDVVFSINNVTQAETNSGATNFIFTVTKTGNTALPSSVDYETVNGTAVAPGDFTAIPVTTLTFGPTDTTMQVTVFVNGDTTNEANEAFTVHLSNASGATIGSADGTGTITNDDAAPTFSIDDVTHNEGDAGTTSYIFTVTKTGTTALNTTVDYATVNGTATAPSDYTAIPITTLTFLPGETTRQLTVLVNGDTTFEPDEAFTVHLSNASISDADGTGTIVNGDCTPPPVGMVGWWPWQNDGNDIIGTSPATLFGSPSFTAGKVGQALVLNGTSQHAIAPSSSSLNVGAGNGMTIDLWINPTDVSTLRPMVEYNRGVNIGLDQGIGGHFWMAVAQDGGGPGSLFTNLRDSDAVNHVVSTPPGVIVANTWQHVAMTYDKTVNNGTITMYVNGVIKRQVTNFGVFTPQTTYPVNFGARLAQGTIRYSGAMDEVEIFNRALSQAEIQTIVNAGSNGKCHPSTFQFESATYAVNERDANATITVTRTGTNNIAATVDYATVAGGTAIAGDDYMPASGTLTFNAGETSKTFDIIINDDNTDEPDETVNIALSNVTGPASLSSQNSAVLTIVDNDIPVDNSGDSGPGSLRDALGEAEDGDTIVFEMPGPRPHNPAGANTITLTSGELVIDKSITLLGPGADLLTLERDANAPAFRIFNVTPGHTVTIQGITISNGLAQGAFPADAGGGIYNDHSTLTVNSCTVSGNSAANYGAGMFNNGQPGNASLTVTNSTLSGNVCGGAGGGIYNFGESTGNATLTVSNTTFSGNSSVAGGGIMNDGTAGSATLTVTNSTFNGNTAPTGGGSGNIYNNGNSAGIATLDIGNTILNAADGNILNVNGTVTSLGYNLSGDGGVTNVESGTGSLNATGDQINTAPILGPLKNNGGPTLTHAPLSNSPAIDRGKDIGVTGQDQRGGLRPVTYNDPSIVPPIGSDRSDIGAVELPPGVIPVSAASVKSHGGTPFPVPLPLSGPVGIECRSGGVNNDYQVILNFAGPVSFTSPAVVTSGSGGVVSSTGNGTNQITLNLTGVTNAQIITLALFDANDGANSGDVGVRMGMLIGDATGSGTVNSTDVSQTKLRSGQAASAANFRSDFNAGGTINATDVSTVKLRSGTSLP